jgi:hypothetical protein
MTDEELFLAARSTTDRTAFERYKKTKNIDESDEAQKRAADARFHQLPLLLAPELRNYALRVLEAARGPKITNDTKFPATLWIHGTTHTKNGYNFDRSFGDFARLLVERSREVAPKGSGWVIEPTTTTDGRRTNASTTAVHALFLDCDSSGEWHKLLEALIQLDYAHVAYQSGGYQPSVPKWRIVLPLASPFDTTSDEKRASWKNVYHHARVVFGAVGELRGEGFDSKTDTPCIPWFLTEKRAEEDQQRQVVAREGHSLDLMALILTLPAIEEIQPPIKTHRGEVRSTGLSDEKLDEIISELSHATTAVPSGRHELYLAISGVLLDRGVPPDEVIAVVEAVSASYPRRHPDKHRDNIHNAKTTVSKWESGAPVTRIGTLNERWPEIAQIIDKVLPDPFAASMQATTEALINATNVRTTPPAVGMPEAPSPGTAPTPKKKRRKLTSLGKEIVPLIKQMEKSKNPMRRFGAILIARILDGESFESPGSAREQIDQLVGTAMGALGFNLPATTWGEVLDLAHHTLLSMDFTQSIERVAAAEQAFLRGQRKRRKWNHKQQTKIDASQERTQAFLNSSARKF